MSLTLTWQDILLRLALACVAGAIIGINRGAHGKVAGLRTTMLVCLAACISMIQVNLLLSVSGKTESSFAQLDMMRLPLGILSGMGFIGAGAILRRNGLVAGVTTAATLWFVTVIGLCFGGGQLFVGVLGMVLGIVILQGLRSVERLLPRDRMARLQVSSQRNAAVDTWIRRLEAGGYRVARRETVFVIETGITKQTFDVHWRSQSDSSTTPDAVLGISTAAGVHEISWLPTDGPEPD